ncbi:hypothetical protein BBP40_005986 [Aspergillus hancockii]|nr:hypothetical protein BBP40_005986 [Aspergillus hancockii]
MLQRIVLTQCAFIEKNFYLNRNLSIEDDLGKAMVRLYRAILHYTAQIQKAQNPIIGSRLLDWVTVITGQPLTELRASVEEERSNMFRWIGSAKHLHREKEAENILYQIDKVVSGLVKLRVAEGAFYDSYVNEHEEFGLANTRTELLSHILEWANATEGRPIFWLNGVAGTGKSAIARIVAYARYLIPTITRQLITRYRRMVPDVLDAIENDPSISSNFLREQFDKLLFQPLLNLRLNPPITTVIVIDALDECDQEDDIQAILQLLSRLQDVQSVRVRIFLTSRPEILKRLGPNLNNNHHDLVLHDLSESGNEHDIRLFLEHKLSEIRAERLLPPDWPGNENIEKLVKMASPLVAVAAIICRSLDQKPSSRVQLDRIYLLILNHLLSGASEDETKQLKQDFQNIVGVIVLLAIPLSVNALVQLINLPGDEINTCLDRLHSFLSVPENINFPVRILHSSFRDYLLLTESPFQVDQDEAHGKIASHCLRLMDTDLKYNICTLTSYGTQRMDMGNQVINQHLPAALEYACCYWVYHLQQSKGRISESLVLSFLKQHFLHWLEALSLVGNISEAVGMIDALQSGIWRSMGAEILDFLYDARRFTLKNAYIAKHNRKIFPDEVSKWIYTLPKADDLWSQGLQTLECQSDSVESVAFSSVGSLLASGSIDKTLKLWDIKTGNVLKTLNGQSDSIVSVAFSHDELLLVSGSIDKTIKIWDVNNGKELQTFTSHSDWINSDTKTGKPLQTLTGHLNSVNSVTFSPDGQTLASGSGDKTIKIWGVKTRNELQTVIGHSEWVYSVAFSPDGQTLASGSYDKTIMLWNPKSDKKPQTLTGHSDWVYSVAFSPDGQALASGSGDKTIRIWDRETGYCLKEITGHSNLVDLVAFSNGRTLTSGSSDNTIRLWDIESGKELLTTKGYPASVYLVTNDLPEKDMARDLLILP